MAEPSAVREALDRRAGPAAAVRVRRGATSLARWVVLLTVAAVIVTPVVYAVLGGFRDAPQLAADPVGLPDPWVWTNYTESLTSESFWIQLRNSVIVAGLSTVLVVLFAALAAFVIARREFRGREVAYTVFTLGLLFPVTVAILPLLILVRDLGLLDNPLGLALPEAAFALPLTIIILRPFFRSIPTELEDAAAMDGCGSLGFFFRILLPLSRPVLVTVAVLAMVSSWNQFLLPLVMLSDPSNWTLPLGVTNFSTQYTTDTARILAYTSLALIPALAFYLVAERELVGGLTARIGEGMTTVVAPYRDPSLPIATRVADLLARMTRSEKVAQLGSFWAFEVIGAMGLDVDRLTTLAGEGIGHVTRLAGSTNLRPVEVADAANAIQRQLIEGTRLGIPAIIHEECLHGLIAWDAPCFQQSIGAAATFDPDVVTAMAATIRRRMLLTGARHALAPVLDVARDPRWGRIEETYGEDPYLATELGCAYIEALQGDDLAQGVLATAKHLVGHGLAEGGRNQAPAHIGPRELHNEQLIPFEAAVRSAGIASVMPAYCDVDGVPCHAATDLLTGLLRDGWGFDEIVASDYMGVEMLSTAHRLSDDLAEAARAALAAGVDAELPRTVAFGSALARALDDGTVHDDLLDAAVERVLRMKVRLGLFERPYVDIPTDADLAALAEAEATAARSLAERSIVLLENRGVLPLAMDTRRVAVVGPIADSARDLLGDYSHLVHMETLREMRTGVDALGVIGEGEIFEPGDELTGRRTIVDAIRAALPDTDVVHARGSEITSGTDDELAAAVASAREADVAVVVLGERSGLTDDSTTGEFRDRVGLGFLGRQQELLEAVVATGTPVVLVVVSGRPLALSWAAEHCAAILLAWVPGDAGPDAIAGVLTGAVNPGGKLPVSMPRDVGQLPLTYRHHPTGGRSHPKGDYVDGPVTPLWPFGFGRSYTTFAIDRLRVDRGVLATTGDTVTIRVDVSNLGLVAGDEVVQLYVRDEEATIARPVRELRGFRRVHLEPGSVPYVVEFRLSTEQLSYVGADLRRVVEPGRVSVQVGASSADLPLTAELRLEGPVVELVDRQHYLTSTTVE